MKKLRAKSIKKTVFTAFTAFVITVVAAASLFVALPAQNMQTAYGDAAPVFLGGVNIRPYSENIITLKKEDLTIQFVPGKQAKNNIYGVETLAHVSATFVFVNTGEKVSLKMGFPFGLAKMRGFNTPNVQNVSVEMDGKKITTNFLTTENNEYDPWVYFNTEFKANETKTLKVTYDALPAGGYFLYVLKTGALWKGPIGELNIDLKFPYSATYPNVLSVTPGGYTIKGNDIIYHFKNYEPDENIIVKFLPYDFANEIAPLRETAYKTNAPEDWYNYLKKLLPVDIVGPYGSRHIHGYFVNEYKTGEYEDFVRSELQKGIEACKGTDYGKILSVAFEAHFTNKDAFLGGVSKIKDLSKIESLFSDELTHPKTKEMGRVVAYYYWWKANALGGTFPKYENFDALAKFIKLAPEYIPFDECKNINSVEIVQYTPYFPNSFPVFEEFISPKKITIKKDASNKIQNIQFDLQIPHWLVVEKYRKIMIYESTEIANKIPDITFNFHGDTRNIIPMTCTIPDGDLALFEEEINKIPQILGTEHSPIYVYPKMLLKEIKENPSVSELDTKGLRESLVSKLEHAQKEIKDNITDYWTKMKDTPDGINTYKGVIELPLEFIDENKTSLKEIPDKIPVEIIKANNSTDAQTGHPANTESKTPFIYLWVTLALVVAVLFIFFAKNRKRNL
jgi:hypothetical protein